MTSIANAKHARPLPDIDPTPLAKCQSRDGIVRTTPDPNGCQWTGIACPRHYPNEYAAYYARHATDSTTPDRDPWRGYTGPVSS